LTVAQFVLVGLNWSDPGAAAYYWRPAALAQGVVSLVFIVIGLFLVSRRPNNAVGWVVAALGVANMAYQAVTEYAVYGLLVDPGSLPWSAEAGVLTQTVWAVPFAAVPLLLLLYPTGRFISRAWATGAVLAGLTVVITAVNSILLMEYRSLGKDLLFLDEVEAALPLEWLVFVALGLLLVSLALGIGSMLVRWHRGDRIERLQIKWLAVAASLLLVQGLWASLLSSDGGFWDASREVLLLVALVALPLAIAVAVLRYRLFEIDRIISRTVSYGLVTGLLILVYLGSVFILRRFLPAEGSLAVAVSTLATAALFSPVRRRVQAVVDRRFNRARYDAEQTLAAFAGRLHDQVDLTNLAVDLREAVVATVQPRTMSFWLRSR
jgi:hypothetical protein